MTDEDLKNTVNYNADSFNMALKRIEKLENAIAALHGTIELTENTKRREIAELKDWIKSNEDASSEFIKDIWEDINELKEQIGNLVAWSMSIDANKEQIDELKEVLRELLDRCWGDDTSDLKEKLDAGKEMTLKDFKNQLEVIKNTNFQLKNYEI